MVTRWQIVSERSTSDNQGCEQLRHRPKRLVYCDQPFRSHIKGSVVGAAGIEPATPTMSTSALPLSYAANMLIMLINGADGRALDESGSVVLSQKTLIYQWVGLCVSALILLTFFAFANQLTLCYCSANGNDNYL